jgi:hypothetical protein
MSHHPGWVSPACICDGQREAYGCSNVWLSGVWLSWGAVGATIGVWGEHLCVGCKWGTLDCIGLHCTALTWWTWWELHSYCVVGMNAPLAVQHLKAALRNSTPSGACVSSRAAPGASLMRGGARISANIAPISSRDCLVSRYTVPRKLRGIDSCRKDSGGSGGSSNSACRRNGGSSSAC